MTHVVALDSQRRLWQLQGVLEFIEGPGPAVVVGCALEAVPDELLPSVTYHRLQQQTFVSPVGHPYPYSASSLAGQPACQKLHFGGQVRNQHLPWYPAWRVRPIVTRENLTDQLGSVKVLDPVNDEPLPAHHSTSSDVEDLNGSL